MKKQNGWFAGIFVAVLAIAVIIGFAPQMAAPSYAAGTDESESAYIIVGKVLSGDLGELTDAQKKAIKYTIKDKAENEVASFSLYEMQGSDKKVEVEPDKEYSVVESAADISVESIGSANIIEYKLKATYERSSDQDQTKAKTAVYTVGDKVSTGKVTKGETVTVTFTNTYSAKKGSLIIYKQLMLGSQAKADDAKIFTFTVQNKETGRYYNQAATAFAMPQKIEVAAGASVQIDDLPIGYYEVTEITADNPEIEGYTYQTTKVGNEEKNVCSVAVKYGVFNDPTQVTFTNEYTRDKGSLQIRMTFEDADGNSIPDSDIKKGNIIFTITGPDGYQKEVRCSEFTDVKYQLWDLDAGKYSVQETEQLDSYQGAMKPCVLSTARSTMSQYDISVSKANDPDNPALAEMKNVYTRDTGKLEIDQSFSVTKLDGSAVDADGILSEEAKETIQYTITGPGSFKDIVSYRDFTNGKYVMSGLPVGSYSVKVKGYDEEGLIKNYSFQADRSDVLTRTEIKVPADQTPTVKYLCTYTEDYGYLNVKKTTVIRDAEDDNIIDKTFKITVQNADGKFVSTEVDEKNNAILKDKKNDAVISIKDGEDLTLGRLAAGTYTVEEDKNAALAGDSDNPEFSLKDIYALSVEEPGPVEVTKDNADSNSPAKVEIVNTFLERKCVKIIRTDLDGNKLSGAGLQVLSADGETVLNSWTSDKENDYIIVHLQADQTYLLREAAPPDDYGRATDSTFSFDSDGRVNVYGDASVTMEEKMQVILVKSDVKKTPLTITARDQTCDYNGNPQGEDNTTYTSGLDSKVTVKGLTGDDTLTSIKLDGRETDAGTYEGKIVPSAAVIKDAAGNDVTENYNITYAAGKLTINKAQPEITTAPTASAITYGQTLDDSGLSGGIAKANGTTVAGTFEWDSPDTVPSVSDSDKTAYDVTFMPNDTGNYKSATCTVTLTVNRADITPAVSIAGWDYGSTANEPTIVDGTNPGGGDVSFWYKGAEEPDTAYTDKVPTDAGEYYLKAKVAETDNYKAGESAPVDFTISPIDMEVTSAGYNGVYDGAAHSITVNAPDGASVEYSEDGTGYSQEQPVYTDIVDRPVSFKVTLKNYKEYTGSQNVKITPAELSVTANDLSCVYNGQDQGPGDMTYKDPVEIKEMVTVSGLQGSDALTSVTVDGQGKDIGRYPLVPSNAAVGNATSNYNITYNEGTLSITAKMLDITVSGSGAKKTYNGKQQTYTGTVTATCGDAAFDASKFHYSGSKAVKGTKAGSYTTKLTAGACIYDDSNYAVRWSIADPIRLTVNKAAITIKADDKSSKYGQSLKKLTYKVSGAYVKGDNLGVKLSTKANKNKAGTSSINVSWNRNPNYKATLISGKYTVGKKPSKKPSKKSGVTAAEKNAARISVNAGLKAMSSGNKVTASWGKVKGASSYVVYANYCDQKKFRKLKTVSGKTTTIDITKLNGRKFNPKKNLKYYVVAYKTVKGKKVKLAKSITAHAPGSKNSKRTNVTGVKVKKSKYTLKKGQTRKIKAKLVLQKKNRKPLQHTKKFRYASSNKKVAKVSKKGKITAVGKGKCSIYVYAVSGVAKKIKVTVK